MPEQQFSNAVDRWDLYRNYRFKLKWEGRYVAGVSKASALKRTTQNIEEGTDGSPAAPRMSPGQTIFEPITLERGVTHDAEFGQWANKVWDYRQTTAPGSTEETNVTLQDFRRDLVLELYNEAGQKAMAYTIHNCWVSEFHALPELDGPSSAIAIQSLVLQNEGWEQDRSIQEPEESGCPSPTS